jgi:purine catabolism regulator
MAVSVQQILALSVMQKAEVVAGWAGLGLPVRWVAVIEWPVDDFVRPGELVLTSGISCDDVMLARLVQEVMSAGAAGVCVGVGHARYVESIGPEVRAVADRNGIPLVELPWELRFADISRAVVDRVLADRYVTPDDTQSLQRLFGDLVIDGHGADAIAQALETAIQMPVIVLDQDFHRNALGPMGEDAVGIIGVDRFGETVDALSATDFTELERSLSGRAVTEIDLPGLPRAHCLSIVAGQRAAGYLLVISEHSDDSMPAIESNIMEHAALALATDALRIRSAVEAEMRLRGHFVWAVAMGVIAEPSEIRSKASLLGYQFRSLLGTILVCSSFQEEPDDLLEIVRRTALRLGRQRGLTVTGSRRGEELLLLVEVGESDRGLRSVETFASCLRDGVLRDGSAPVNIAIASQPRPLIDLADGYHEAQQTMQIGRYILGEGALAEARALEPFMMLSRLGQDLETRRIAAKVIQPLVDYDRGRESGLMHTLEVYLDANCNASAAARQLFFNRHSLLYRLRKIESLTGRSLASSADRFVLELSVRLRRFGTLDPDVPSMSPGVTEGG